MLQLASGWVRRRAISRIVVLLAGSAGSAALGFLTHLALTRSLPVAEYGRFVALLTVVNVLQVFSGYGVGWFWLQVFGREGWAAFRWIAPTLKLTALASVIGSLGLFAYVVAVEPGPLSCSLPIAACFVAVLLGQSLAGTTSARFQLEEKYGALALWQLAPQGARFLVAAFLLVCGIGGYSKTIGGYALVGVGMTVLSIRWLQLIRGQRIELVGHDRRGSGEAQGGGVSLLRALTGATPYCFATLFYLAYSQIVVAMVERLSGPQSAAIYNVAFLIVSGIYVIPGVIYMKYLVAKLFRWWANDQGMFASVFYLGIVVGAALGTVCMLVVIVTAPFLVQALFGARYSPAVPVLKLLAMALPLRFIEHALGAALFSEENMKRKVWYLGAAAMSCVFWSAVLIPRLGATGAAAATVMAEITLIVSYAWGVTRHVEPIRLLSIFSIGRLRLALAYVEGRGREPRIGNRAPAPRAVARSTRPTASP